MPHTFATNLRAKVSHRRAIGGLLFVFTGMAEKGTDLRFPLAHIVHSNFSVYHSLSPSGLVVWASGNPLQKDSELLFMSPTPKRVLYSPREIRAKGKGECEDELLKHRVRKSKRENIFTYYSSKVALMSHQGYVTSKITTIVKTHIYKNN